MTFDEWYSANIAPTIPTDIPPVLRQAARESMAACWNAALDAVLNECGTETFSKDGTDIVICKIGAIELESCLRAT